VYKSHSQILITLVVPVYLTSDQSRLNDVLRHYELFPQDVKNRFQVVLVNDCSPIAISLPELDLNCSLYEIVDNIHWNQAGARNLGAMIADTPYLLLTDLDIVFPEETVIILLKSRHSDKMIYTFERYCNNNILPPHPNTFFLSKQDFIILGGVDEDFCGEYGFEDIFFADVAKRAGFTVQQVRLKIEAYRKESSSDEHDLKRCTDRNKKLLHKKRQISEDIYSREMLRFKWKYVAQTKTKKQPALNGFKLVT
jgi:glycosyltransferase involved in cell wall biosynthesis